MPGRLNPNFNPTFRTIAAEFEVMPGSIVPADLAPTQVGVTVQLPGQQTTAPVQCLLDVSTPQLYAVNQPYAVRPSGSTVVPVTIRGVSFGLTKGTGQVTLDNVPLATTTWNDTTIVASITSSTAYGPHLLRITSSNGKSTVNGLTFHVVSAANNGNNYNPVIFEVGPGRTYAPAETLPAAANHAIQRALDAPYPNGANSNRPKLVVVYPNNQSANPRQNPRGAYYENLIITRNVKLQGVGPGSPTGAVRGSIIDGGAFAGDSPVATDWYTRIGTATWSGNQTIYDGAVVSLYLPSSGSGAFPTGDYNANTAPSIDGFDLRGGDQQGFPGNINAIGGGPTGLPGGLITQGGAVFANGYANNLQITNNLVQNNGGAYGTIRVGTPDIDGATGDGENNNIVIAHNRVIANAGTNQAGGIGLFRGSDQYQVSYNDICGNFSAEYGGGVSVVGLSPNGRINNNRIYFNRSYDEGGGIMIAGGLPTNPGALSPGSGAVDIFDNLIQANLANDDGGGLRFLMAGNFPMNVYNNFIVNNISTHEGGGIGINDAPNVRVFNNTIMKNLTTATAITSSGSAAPAGLSTSVNSTLLQTTLPTGSPLFSNPLLFNNIFWDNRAGTRAGNGVVGLSVDDANHWDMGVADGPGPLSPTNSVLQSTVGIAASPTNVFADPLVAVSYDVAVTFNAWRNNPAFLGAIMISADLPPELMGNYHINLNTPPYNLGAASKAIPTYQGGGTRAAPTDDIDGPSIRPANGGYDAGADEVPGPTTANLGITKSDGATSVQVGQQLTYTITVTNAGPSVVNGATVNDILPARLGSAFWSCAPASSCAAASGTDNISAVNVTLASGASVTFRVTATVLAGSGTTLVNTATVVVPSGVTDPDLTNNTATDTDTIVTPVNLGITKTDGLTSVNRGGAVRYTIVVTNPATGSAAVTGATVVDNFPNTLTGTINWTCTATLGATCGGTGGNQTTGSGAINRTVNMPIGSTLTFATTSGSVSTSATTLVNTATVSVPVGYVDTATANNSATDTDTINPVHLGALSATSVNTGGATGTTWTASVTITVHDVNHAVVSGFTSTGSWGNNAPGNGTANCTTNASSGGQCTLTRTGLSRANVASLTYSVTNLNSTVVGPYQSSSNDVATSIVVSRPLALAALLRPAAIRSTGSIRR